MSVFVGVPVSIPIFVGWRNVEFVCISPQRHREIFVSVPFWFAYYEASRFLYVPSPSVFAYLNSIDKAGSGDAGQVSTIARTNNFLMTLSGSCLRCLS